MIPIYSIAIAFAIISLITGNIAALIAGLIMAAIGVITE